MCKIDSVINIEQSKPSMVNENYDTHLFFIKFIRNHRSEYANDFEIYSK